MNPATRRPGLWATLFPCLALAACAPEMVEMVSESRMIAAPAKPATCELQFLQLSMMDMVPGGAYDILGYVSIGASGAADPLDPGNKEIVRPRACAMGGEGITIPIAGSSTNALGATGSRVVYAVVRKHQQASAAAPSKF